MALTFARTDRLDRGKRVCYVQQRFDNQNPVWAKVPGLTPEVDAGLPIDEAFIAPAPKHR